MLVKTKTTKKKPYKFISIFNVIHLPNLIVQKQQQQKKKLTFEWKYEVLGKSK